MRFDLVSLTEADVADALQLSDAAHWNQNAADWHTLLARGRAWGFRTVAGNGEPARLVATTLALPYDGFAWVSMVLVLPDFRGQGLAAQLLKQALSWLQAQGLQPVLDATPAGRPVYLRQGFVDTWGFERLQREASAAPPAALSRRTRALSEADWPAIAALDAPVFGADRLPLLRVLASRLPATARVAEQGGRLAGYVLGRDGRQACQIGPLVAADDDIATALLSDALAGVPGPVFMDLCGHRSALRHTWLARGFEPQRPFTRMVWAPAAVKTHKAPGDPAPCVLVAGPELG